ncbi:hydantoinase/oxoprolinase family protein [Methanocalculus sp. MC3]
MIGIDIGGANTKIVDGDEVIIRYCPLWKEAPITEILSEFDGEAAVVMSGELADCFYSKNEGISFIVNAVREVLPKARFYGTDGRFHTKPVPELAAANWLASADLLRDRYSDSVLVDFGSTTADIIPLSPFDALLGQTDLTRLRKGYLIYCGMLRTPVASLLRSVIINGEETPLSTEYFASAGDAHLVLGHITPEEYTTPTPDGKEATRDLSLARLARSACADLDEIGEAGAVAIATAFWKAERNLIEESLKRIGKRPLLAGGIGSRLLGSSFGGTDLFDELGQFADALPAYAVREVAERNGI